MPSLNIQDVQKFWHEHQDKTIYKILAFMESVENWTIEENQELEQALTKLGNGLDNIGYVDLQGEDKIIQIASYLKLGRALRLLQCLDIAHPGAASKLLTFAKKNSKTDEDIYDLFTRRNVVFERMRLLSRIFSNDRLNTVLKALGEMEHD